MTGPRVCQHCGHPVEPLAERVLEWLQRNPDEELMVEDIVVKFGAHRRSVPVLLQAMVKIGKVKQERQWSVRGAPSVYSLGAAGAAA